MKEIFIVVGIALFLFLVFIFLDKGKNIFKKFKKTKTKKEKPVKEKKEKKNKQQKTQNQDEKVDYDTTIKQENVEYGKEISPAVQDVQTEVVSKKLFVDEQPEQEEIDLDKMFEELRRQESASPNAEYEQMPNFDDMSMAELDSFLEQSFDEQNLSLNGRNALDIYGYDDNLSGEELGRVLRNLPKQIKILILSDILKRKF